MTDPPTAAAVLPLLGDCPIGRPYTFMTSVDSTNRLLRTLAEDGAPEGAVVVADAQTAGRGRRGRGWVSAPGAGIWMSVLLRPRLDPRRAGLLTLMTAVAVREAVDTAAGVETRIKWPNDLLLGDRKLGGILIEAAAGAGSLRYAIVGIGLNVRPPAGGFPPEAGPAAGTLAEAAGREPSRPELTAALCRSLARWYRRLTAGDEAGVLDAWRRGASWLWGRRVAVHTGPGGGSFAGIAVDVAPDGGLIVATDRGERTLYAG